jgi:putative colanic acid biosynthesis UDP-glucose lipid carrier transferase
MSLLVKLLFFLGDLLFLNLSIALAFYFTGSAHRADDVYLIIFSNLTWLFLISVASPYTFSRNWDRPKTLKNQFIFIFTHLFVVASLVFFYDREYTLLQISLIYCFFVPVFYFSKFITYFFVQRLGAQTQGIKNILMISQSDIVSEAKQYLNEQPDWKYNFLDIIDVKTNAIPMQQLQSLCDQHAVDEIYVFLSFKADLDELIAFGLGKLIPIKLMADARVNKGTSADEKHFNHVAYVSMSAISSDEPGNKIIKRIFDLIFSSFFILLIMSWLYPLVAILIRMDSNGPVLFKQKRSGEKNRPFICLKFRSMVTSDDAHLKQATKYDSRITRLGAFIRKTSIDELPQFFNVFMGHMSIVGPRPHMIKHTEEYSRLLERFMDRHYVKPGITGLAQAMGYRGETRNLIDMKNRITLDRFYIENWSFVFDLKIIYLTIVSVLKGSEKAY